MSSAAHCTGSAPRMSVAAVDLHALRSNSICWQVRHEVCINHPLKCMQPVASSTQLVCLSIGFCICQLSKCSSNLHYHYLTALLYKSPHESACDAVVRQQLVVHQALTLEARYQLPTYTSDLPNHTMPKHLFPASVSTAPLFRPHKTWRSRSSAARHTAQVSECACSWRGVWFSMSSFPLQQHPPRTTPHSGALLQHIALGCLLPVGSLQVHSRALCTEVPCKLAWCWAPRSSPGRYRRQERLRQLLAVDMCSRGALGRQRRNHPPPQHLQGQRLFRLLQHRSSSLHRNAERNLPNRVSVGAGASHRDVVPTPSDIGTRHCRAITT